MSQEGSSSAPESRRAEGTCCFFLLGCPPFLKLGRREHVGAGTVHTLACGLPCPVSPRSRRPTGGSLCR